MLNMVADEVYARNSYLVFANLKRNKAVFSFKTKTFLKYVLQINLFLTEQSSYKLMDCL